MEKKQSRGIIITCLTIIAVLLLFIVFRFVIPIITGTISEIPTGRVYTMKDVDPKLQNLVNADATRFAYSKLDDNEKKAYDRLLYGVLSYANRIDIKECKLSVSDLRKVYSCLRNDYPELFYIHGNCEIYTNTATNLVTDCLPEYLYKKDSVLNKAEVLTEIRDALVAKVKGQSDYEKAMFFFDYIIDNTSYDKASLDQYTNGVDDPTIDVSSTIVGTIFNHKALCEGYTRTYQFFLNAVGIDCLYVSGKAKEEDHAWNYVKLDNDYYCVDLTWCDPQSDTEIKSYSYCMINEGDFSGTRVADTPYNLPPCNGFVYNYYRYNDFELPAFDTNTLARMFLKAYDSGHEFIEFRCASAPVVEAFKMAVQSQEIFDCYKLIEEKYNIDINHLNYVIVEDALVIRVIFN